MDTNDGVHQTEMAMLGSTEPKTGGKWSRASAVWIDSLVVYAIMRVIAGTAQTLGLYVPRELTFLVLAVVYSIAFIAWRGWTPGKALCGLRVQANGSGNGRLMRFAFRESLGKILSVAVFLVGVLAMVLWKPLGLRDFIPFGMLIPLVLAVVAPIAAIALQWRRPLHDVLAGTRVVRDQGNRWSRLGPWVAICTLGLLLVSPIRPWLAAQQADSEMGVGSGYVLPAHTRNAADLVETENLGEEDERKLARWLDEHGSDPVKFAVAKASAHRLVIFGEQHEQRETLQYFNELIPVLYDRAGVTRIGMEMFMATENAAIAELVTAAEFDHEGALALARRMDTWGAWGFKGYWQILETVWQVNQSISASESKIEVIGLGVPIDAMSFSMVGIEEGPGSNTPPWEKLRLARLLSDFPLMLKRDEIMAQTAAARILDEGAKGIILIGAAHSAIRCPMPGRADGSKARMGFMLSQKYPGDVFQIAMHQSMASTDSPEQGLSSVIERVMRQRNDLPVGFDVEGGPFAFLRDGSSWEFADERLAFGDIATGYVFLAPLEKINRSEWVPGYVSTAMFVANRPFYESWGHYYGRSIQTADDANELFSCL